MIISYFMYIMTWNINSIRARIHLLFKIINIYRPDIIALQETKTPDSFFPNKFFNELGYYYVYFVGQKYYNGVAFISKVPCEKVFTLQFYNQDKRHLSISVYGIEIHNFYIPAGGDVPNIYLNDKFKHKLNYISLMQDWFIKYRSKDHKIILTGDFNIAPYEHDVWSSRLLSNVITHTSIERDLLLEFQYICGFIDTSRYFIPYSQKFYTWWSYRNINWKSNNKGRRLDQIWISFNLKDSLLGIKSIKDVRGYFKPSDHIPYLINLDINRLNCK